MTREDAVLGATVQFTPGYWQQTVTKEICTIVDRRDFTDLDVYDTNPDVIMVALHSLGKPYESAELSKTQKNLWGIFSSINILELVAHPYKDFVEDQPLEEDDDI